MTKKPMSKAQRAAKLRAEAAAYDAMTPEQRKAYQAEKDARIAAFKAANTGVVTPLELEDKNRCEQLAYDTAQAASHGMTLAAWKAEQRRIGEEIDRVTDTATDWGMYEPRG